MSCIVNEVKSGDIIALQFQIFLEEDPAKVRGQG